MSSKAVGYTAKMVPTHRIRRFKMQPREYFDPVEITARAMSMQHVGQQLPITVEPVIGDPDHDYELIDGESRWLAAKQAKILEMLVLVRDVPFRSANEKHLASLVANFNRSGHTPLEISEAVMRQLNSGMSQMSLALALGKSSVWVSHHVSLQRLHPDARALMDPTLPENSRLAMSTAVSLARVPAERQLEVLANAKRKDGRILKAKIDEQLRSIEDRKNKHADKPSRRKKTAEFALRAIALAGSRMKTVSMSEAREIFEQLKADGELNGLGSVEDLMLALGQDDPLTMSLRKRFPDLPIIKRSATSEEREAHAVLLREYWTSKTAVDAELLIQVAYPSRPHLKPWKPTKWHRTLK